MNKSKIGGIAMVICGGLGVLTFGSMAIGHIKDACEDYRNKIWCDGFDAGHRSQQLQIERLKLNNKRLREQAFEKREEG